MILRAFRRWAMRPRVTALHRQRAALIARAEAARARHGRVSHIQARIEVVTREIMAMEVACR